MILSVHMHPKPSFTLFCKQIYYLEMIQLDSKLVTCFLYTCSTTSSPEKPQGRIQIAISLKSGVYRLRQRRIQISREQTSSRIFEIACETLHGQIQVHFRWGNPAVENHNSQRTNQLNNTLLVSVVLQHFIEYSIFHNNTVEGLFLGVWKPQPHKISDFS